MYDPSIIPTIRSKAETSAQRTNQLNSSQLPKCPLFGDSTVVHVHLLYLYIAK